jgi:hypothetical protein
VDFPAPFTPMSPTFSPRDRRKLTPEKSVRSRTDTSRWSTCNIKTSKCVGCLCAAASLRNRQLLGSARNNTARGSPGRCLCLLGPLWPLEALLGLRGALTIRGGKSLELNRSRARLLLKCCSLHDSPRR